MIKTFIGFHSLREFVTLTYKGTLEYYDEHLKFSLLEQANHTTIKENKIYRIKFSKRYWDDYRIRDEELKCDVGGGLYDIGQRDSQFIGHDQVMKMIKELKPYDIILEMEYEDEE